VTYNARANKFFINKNIVLKNFRGGMALRDRGNSGKKTAKTPVAACRFISAR
jgi:hypothetical protein